MLNANLLHTDPTPVALGLVGWLVFRYGCLRLALRANCNVLLGLHLLPLEELIHDITRDE